MTKAPLTKEQRKERREKRREARKKRKETRKKAREERKKKKQQQNAQNQTQSKSTATSVGTHNSAPVVGMLSVLAVLVGVSMRLIQ